MQGDFAAATKSAPSKNFELPPWASGMFGTNQPEDFYFFIQDRDGKEMQRSGKEPSHIIFGTGEQLFCQGQL